MQLDNIPDVQTYEDQQAEIKAEQAGMSRGEVASHLRHQEDPYRPGQPRFTDVFDPETATPQKHRWIDRGLKMSCEGAGHPMHQAWKIGRK